jgi:hypothetical protein
MMKEQEKLIADLKEAAKLGHKNAIVAMAKMTGNAV